ncbi:hypothetical protein NPIL_477211 [Nephila pilipes]|uniref:Uncharacterized protein n=1 Tax=Nephila pilipes TaxID=299642 RepID=A0A8X6U774_NEPPI|nr:hypothetical protein NPIL_477211 [Nephila pilipes]
MCIWLFERRFLKTPLCSPFPPSPSLTLPSPTEVISSREMNWEMLSKNPFRRGIFIVHREREMRPNQSLIRAQWRSADKRCPG